MHDVICVNLYHTKSELNPRKKGVTGALSTTQSVIEHYVRMKETSKLIPLVTQKEIIYVQICH